MGVVARRAGGGGALPAAGGGAKPREQAARSRELHGGRKLDSGVLA
jgi:hypothetical protein